MLRRISIGLLLPLALTGSLTAQDVESLVFESPSQSTSNVPAAAPALAADSKDLPEHLVPLKLLTEIAEWLSTNFGLPAARALPKIAFSPPERIAAIRYGGLLNNDMAPSAAPARQSSGDEDVVAVYLHTTQTILLPEGWRGLTPAEVSVLVHEMVHHLQHQAQIRYPCSEAREKLAYQAQERWLARFGHTLKGAFGIDALTLLIRTNCGI
jgi:hypothetical protein